MQSVYLQFAVSLLFLIISANFLLKFVERFAAKVKISPLIIGATLVAIGTSLPETSVAVSSIIQKVPSLSFGNIIGASIANFCLILGIGITIFPIRIGTHKTQKNNYVLLLLTVFFAILFLLPEDLRKSLGIILVIFYVIFLVIEIFWGEVGSKKEDKKALSKMEKVKTNIPLCLFGITISLGGLIGSSKFLVSSAVIISKGLGLEEEIIGLSIVAIGTTLPEMATTIVSGINKDWKLLYGNVQGSNIFNLSIIGAMLIMFGENGYYIDHFSLFFMLIITISVVVLSHKYEGTNIPRLFGVMYLGLYIFYLFKIYNLN